MLSKFSIINIYQFKRKKVVDSLRPSTLNDLSLAIHGNYKNNKD